MTKSRTDDTSRSERAAQITAMAELNNQMRKAVLDKTVLDINQFYLLLSEYANLASPLSENKVDQLFMEQFANRFNKLCNFAGENVSALAVERKNATDDMLKVLFLATKILDENNQYNPAASMATNDDKQKFVDAALKLYQINHDILNSGQSILLKENAALALIGESTPHVDTPLSEKEVFFFKVVEPVLFGGKSIHALSADLYNDVMKIPEEKAIETNSSEAHTDLSDMFQQSFKAMWEKEVDERMQATHHEENDIGSEDEWGNWDDAHQEVIDDWGDWDDTHEDQKGLTHETQHPVNDQKTSLIATSKGKIEYVSKEEAKAFFISELNSFIESQVHSSQPTTLFGHGTFHAKPSTSSQPEGIVDVAIKIRDALSDTGEKNRKDLQLSQHEIELIQQSALKKVIKNYAKPDLLPQELKKALDNAVPTISQENKSSGP